MLPFKLAWRLAGRLAAAWGDVADRLARARHADRLARVAAASGWAAVAPRRAAERAARLDELVRAVEGLRAAPTPPCAPGPADWLAEVRQVEAEFGAVEVRWGDRVVRATTGPVALEGVDLGPFAVELHWDRATAAGGPARCFAVVALDPHPAAGREEVVHPHVDGTTLCAGEAAGPIERAVAAGRLADAFVIARAVLSTYNPASPYVPLAEWAGVRCAPAQRPLRHLLAEPPVERVRHSH